MRALGELGVLFLSIFACSLAFAEEWQKDAIRLESEEPREREAAIAKLSAIKDLDTKLRESLKGQNPWLALSVIEHLHREALLPELLTIAKSDPDGFIYLTINSLGSKNSSTKITTEYRSRLQTYGPERGAGPKVAMLGGLVTLKALLPAEELQPLLADSSDGVRQEAAQLAALAAQKGDAKSLKLLKDSCSSERMERMRATCSALIRKTQKGGLQ